MLQDPHIIKYYGQRSEGSKIYLFLEYAPGGELFDKIGKINSCSYSNIHIPVKDNSSDRKLVCFFI